jgi:hypothetical protein
MVLTGGFGFKLFFQLNGPNGVSLQLSSVSETMLLVLLNKCTSINEYKHAIYNLQSTIRGNSFRAVIIIIIVGIKIEIAINITGAVSIIIIIA